MLKLDPCSMENSHVYGKTKIWQIFQQQRMSIMIAAEIDDKEIRDLMGVDVTNTFIQTKRTQK